MHKGRDCQIVMSFYHWIVTFVCHCTQHAVFTRSCKCSRSHSEHQIIASQGHQGGGGVVGHAGHPTPHPDLPLQPLPLEVPDAQLAI